MELLGRRNRSVLDDGGIHHLISGVQNDAVSTSSSSFTALLELPPSQAVQLLHSPLAPPPAAVVFPSDGGLIERAARFSVFSGGSPDTTAGPLPSNSSGGFPAVKCEPLVSDPTVEDNSAPPRLRPAKRKEREKKGNNNNNGSKKKSKNGAGKESSEEEAEKLPYVHVRARRGQATDSHSLAERARREKINARMKLLQELVPGCNKISGTALVLDEIINHVQSLQQQVEFLSMRLAAVNPSIDFNLDSLLAAENGSMVESNFSGMIMPLMWPELQFSGNRQHYQQQQQWPIDPLNQQVWVREEDSPNFVAPDLSYDSSGNSVSLRSNQVKMEL